MTCFSLPRFAHRMTMVLVLFAGLAVPAVAQPYQPSGSPSRARSSEYRSRSPRDVYGRGDESPRNWQGSSNRPPSRQFDRSIPDSILGDEYAPETRFGRSYQPEGVFDAERGFGDRDGADREGERSNLRIQFRNSTEDDRGPSYFDPDTRRSSYPTFREPAGSRSNRMLGGWEVDNQDNAWEPGSWSQPQTEIRRRISIPELSRAPIAPSVPARPHVESRPAVQEALTRRYQDAALLRFASSLQPQQGLALYAEVLAYVEERHLQPPAVQAMAQRGLYNVSQGLQNPAFLQVSRMNPQAAQQMPQVLAQLSQQPVKGNDGAVALLRQTIAATQPYGLPSSMVMLEFIEGALDGLDRFSAFLPEETARSQNQQLSETLVGIGVTIEADTRGMKVVKTVSGSPAQQAGLQKGDILTMVDGRNLSGMGLDGAIALLTGAEGTPVSLGIDRNGRPAQMSVTRRRVETHSVNEVQMIDPQARIGYAKLDIFGAKSKAELEAAMANLHRQGMQAMVLDLRGNPGGLLTTAIELSDMFLPQGTIVSTRGRTSQDDSVSQAHRENTWKVPLVVLIDGDSASASEIFAAAIQDNRRGVIVGRHSYGKGTVQTLFPMQSASCSLRLTTARFYAPSGKPMAGSGVEPDYVTQEGTDAQGRELDVLAGINAARQLLTTNR